MKGNQILNSRIKIRLMLTKHYENVYIKDMLNAVTKRSTISQAHRERM